MIIFGMRTRQTPSGEEDVIEKACPQCGGNLELYDLKRWFTLYFIPVIPLNTIESFYKCEKCEQTYKKSIKEMLQNSTRDRAKVQQEVKKTFAVALAACMTHMANIDGKISKEEKEEIKKLKTSLPEFKSEIDSTVERISKDKNDSEVFSVLSKARSVLTVEAITMIVAQVARVLLADGKIDKKEEKLMKEYLLACGIPREMYSQIIEKVKGKMNKKKIATEVDVK